MSGKGNDRAASVRARLLNVAKAQKADFQSILVRFALERLLYRLSVSPHADRFLLKGALLFVLWYDTAHRLTRDADLLGFGNSEMESVGQIFREIAAANVDDGIVFDPATVSVQEIRKEDDYGGVRVTLSGELAKARCKVQVDIGFGDSVVPGPIDSVFPVLLEDLPRPHIRTYPAYTVISEKLHAIVSMGLSNTRMKDYIDLYVLAEREALDTDLMAKAIRATFGCRGKLAPTELPEGLTDVFAQNAQCRARWSGFLRKNGLQGAPLEEVVERLAVVYGPALRRASQRTGV